jgi:hypothetical protein
MSFRRRARLIAASSNCGAVHSGRPDPSHSSNACKEAELVNLQGPKELIGRKRIGRERKRAEESFRSSKFSVQRLWIGFQYSLFKEKAHREQLGGNG